MSIKNKENNDNQAEVETVEEDTIEVQTLESDLEELEASIDVDSTVQAKTEEPTQDKPKKPRSQKRIREQAKRIKELEKELEEKSTTHEADESGNKNSSEAPDIDDFDSFDEYEQAKAKYESKEDTKKEEPKKADDKTTAEVAHADEVYNDLVILLDDVADKYEDFKQVTENENLILSIDLMEDITDFEDSAGELLYYIAKDPALSKELSELTPKQRMRKLVLLEDKIENGAVPQARKIRESKAPEPIEPISGSRHSVKTIDDDDVTQEEMDAFVNSKSRGTRGGWL